MFCIICRNSISTKWTHFVYFTQKFQSITFMMSIWGKGKDILVDVSIALLKPGLGQVVARIQGPYLVSQRVGKGPGVYVSTVSFQEHQQGSGSGAEQLGLSWHSVLDHWHHRQPCPYRVTMWPRNQIPFFISVLAVYIQLQRSYIKISSKIYKAAKSLLQ